MTKLTSTRVLPNLVLCLCLGLLTPSAFAQGELRFCLRSEPKTFDPLQVEDDASVAIRYLTGGTLVRMNRQSQVLSRNWRSPGKFQKMASRLRSSCAAASRSPTGRHFRRKTLPTPFND